MDIPNLNLPDDLPEDWTPGQIVSPDGTDVGLSKQHGYNYLNGAVNLLKVAIQAMQGFFSGVAPIDNPVFTGSISLGRSKDSIVGYNSVAEGNKTVASGIESHAEGLRTTASGDYSHAEGLDTVASGDPSHAEGFWTTASGNYSHAEGNHSTASGIESHAEGFGTTASGESSHAEGYGTTASGNCSHAEGFFTTSENFASLVIGKYNAPLATGSSGNTNVGDAFVIGIGTGEATKRNGFRVTFEGAVYGTGSYHTSGADYAEYFEWKDGNPEKQDRVGYFVTLDGEKIRLAGPRDFALGIVSGNPCIIGNSDETWLGFYLHDEFGRFIREYLEEETVEVTSPEDAEDIALWKLKNRVEEKDGKYYQTVSKVVDHETPSWRLKVNPEYDPEKGYISRADRPEWDAVGMLGVLTVRDDGTCKVNGFAKVSEGGIATAADGYVPGGTYRVIARVNDNAVKVIFR